MQTSSELVNHLEASQVGNTSRGFPSFVRPIAQHASEVGWPTLNCGAIQIINNEGTVTSSSDSDGCAPMLRHDRFT